MQSVRAFLIPVCALSLWAQDPVASIEGHVIDPGGDAIRAATVSLANLDTAQSRSVVTSAAGLYRFALVPVGRYSLTIEAPGFARFTQQPIQLSVSESARADVQMQLAGVKDSVTVEADAGLVDTLSNAQGKTVTAREILDLPLNGRNFTQLGLLQAGVAPMTGSVAGAGGSLRAGQAYAVNGQRPESNTYLLDGAKNINRMDGGYALRVPVDAIAEFRIITHTAPPEYGGASGSSTSVVTKSGGNSFHGSLYEFFRNDVFDARNFFSRDVEPLKQNQFGGTLGGPLRRNRLFFFGYGEGFVNRQGFTRSGTVPTPAQRQGDFSGRVPPLINFATGGTPFPDNTIPESMISPTGLRVSGLYPLGNTASSVHTATVVTRNNAAQAGGRLDWRITDTDQLNGRYSYSMGDNLNPISIRGSDLPGFPVHDDIGTHSAAIQESHIFTQNVVNAFRAAFFRHVFLFDERLNHMAPRELGFNYDATSSAGQSAPFFNVNGYSPVGGSITGPRTSAQTSWEFYDALSWVHGAHSLKFGGEVRRTYLNMYQAIAPNAFFVFTPSFPTNDGFANLLLGRPLVFYQGLGDMSRGMRGWESSLFAQDEWRISRRLTLNYGLRWEINTPLVEVRDRMNAFVPGVQSAVFPEAPRGLLFPGDPGVPAGGAPVFYKALMPRAGFAWNPDGRGIASLRASYAVSYDAFANGMGLASQVPVSSLPWTQLIQFSGPGVNFTDPYAQNPRPPPGTFPRPLTLVVMDHRARPPYAQNWNFTIQRALPGNFLVDLRYIGTKGTRLPRNIEANPAVFGSGATAQNADRRRLYANCPALPTAPCDFTHVAMQSYITNSTYHAFQSSLLRRYTSGFGFNVSYWFSKTLDYLSAMNLGGAAARPMAGENDVAQNPFDLRAEHGPSLFDARHRFTFSGSYEVPFAGKFLKGWQLNGIVTANSATPFTVFDTTNVSLQASHPPLSGYSGSRPDLVGDPNTGPHRAEQWLVRGAFRRLNPITEAGRFGNAGRNIARGPALANIDLSLLKSFRLTERHSIQFRAEAFNVANHPNFLVPVSDLNSPNFGRVLESGSARLVQFGLKLLF